MKIEKINENKLKIILSKQDLIDKNIDVHFLNKNNIEVQELFWDILHEAEIQYDFDLTQSQLLVEGMYNSGGNFILTVTKIGSPINSSDTFLRRPPELQIKRKTIHSTNYDTIYCFSTFDDFTQFCKRLNRLPEKYINTLYILEDKYYINFANLNENEKLSKKVSSIICDYTESAYNSNVFKNKLNEYGQIIVKDNAIQTISKYF